MELRTPIQGDHVEYEALRVVVDTDTDTDTGTDTGTGTGTDTNTEVVVIEEGVGLCTFDGDLEFEHSGYLGFGYTNTTNMFTARVEWGVEIGQAGIYTLNWRYANGEQATRIGELFVNDISTGETVSFPSTNLWTTWNNQPIEIQLEVGVTTLVLQATGMNGLPNIDSLTISGPRVTAVDCN